MANPLYIEIPEGMEFQKKEMETDQGVVTVDYFVDPKGKQEPINIQAAVKTTLQHLKRYADSVTVDGLTIHIRPRQLPFGPCLEYTHVKNGKEPGKGRVIDSRLAKSFNPARQTHHGQRWHDPMFFSVSKQERDVITEKDKEKRRNLRKTGESPASN